jgi:hypothetical protein
LQKMRREMKNGEKERLLGNSFIEKFEAVVGIQRLVDRILFYVSCFSNSIEHIVQV